jgi:hypothetical protein
MVPGQVPLKKSVNVMEVGEQTNTSTPGVDATTEEASRAIESATEPNMLARDLKATRDMLFLLWIMKLESRPR